MVKELQAAGRIYAAVNIQDFIKLPSKEVEDLTKDLIKYIAELYTGPNRDAKIDEEVIKQPQIKLNKALDALQKHCLYKEQQEDCNRDIITTLLRHKRRLQN